MAPPKHLQRHQLGPELLLRPLLTQLFPSVVEELRVELCEGGVRGASSGGGYLGWKGGAEPGAGTRAGLLRGSKKQGM